MPTPTLTTCRMPGCGNRFRIRIQSKTGLAQRHCSIRCARLHYWMRKKAEIAYARVEGARS